MRSTPSRILFLASFMSVLFLASCNQKQDTASTYPEDNIEFIVKGPGKYIQAHQLIRTLDGDQYPRYKNGDPYKALLKAQSQMSSKRKEVYEWIERGPSNSGGRVRGIVVDPADTTDRTWFVASVGGGIWHTSDAGGNWELLTPDFPSLATSTIAMAESNQDVLYVGTGEGFGNIDGIVGAGMFKSYDRGRTWEIIPSTQANDFANITRIIVNPEDENEVLVSTRTLNEANTLRTYIYKSTDGGETWEQKFGRSNSIVQQLVASPGNFDVMYATVNREGVMRSEDSGETWEYVWTTEDDERRIELAISPKDDGVIYLSCELGEGSRLYFTRDTFNTVTEPIFNGRQPNWLVNQGWYDNTIAVHPFNDSIVWVAGQGPLLELKMGNEIGTIKKFGNYNSLAPFIDLLDNSAFEEDPAGPATRLFAELPVSTGTTNEDLINIEIRFGDGASSKAHLISVNVQTFDFNFVDMVDVPFEAWDAANNRQIALSLFDVDGNGEWTFEDFSSGNDVFHDVVTTNNVDYTETPNDGIVNNAVYKAQYYMFMGRSPSYTGPRDTLPFGFIFFNTEEENGLISDFVPIVDGYNAYGDISSVGSKGVHVDHHNIIFLPKDSASGTFNVINGNDGGVAFSEDNGENFSQTGDSFNNSGNFQSLYGFNVSQFYGIEKKTGESRYIGGTQDNGTWISPSEPDSSTIWIGAPSGDGFEAAWHSERTNEILETSQRNVLYKSYDEGLSWRRVTLPESRGPFITRLASSELDPDLVFMVSDTGVLRSADFAETWERVEMPELWNYHGSWGPPIKISLADPAYVWTGSRITADSRICYSVDGGLSFFHAKRYDRAETGLVTGIATHPNDPNTAFVLFSQKGAPKVLMTNDLGETWTDLSGFGPESTSTGFPDVAVYSLLVMPWDDDVIWAGTEIGLFESLDGGQTWEFADNGLPAVSVWEMKIIDNEIVLATHGRGVWTLNTDQFDISSTSSQALLAAELDVFPNPAQDLVNIQYDLEESQRVNVILTDLSGKQMMSLNQGSKNAGSHALQLDVSTLPSGMYVLNLQGEKGMLTKKLLVE